MENQEYANLLMKNDLKFSTTWILASEDEREKLLAFLLDVLEVVREDESEIEELKAEIELLKREVQEQKSEKIKLEMKLDKIAILSK
mgnify:CR=1 FL=1